MPIVYLYHWARYEDPENSGRVMHSVNTVESLTAQGYEQWGVDKRYGTILMRKQIEIEEIKAGKKEQRERKNGTSSSS